MVEVALHGARAEGRVALVDDADAELVAGYHWNVVEHRPGSGKFYAYAHVPGSGKRGWNVKMHQLIAGRGMDHANGNGLDNRRSNLRVATLSQNQANSGSRGGSSRFKGVSAWKHGKWRAQIRDSGTVRYLGTFASEEDAARAYDAAATERWGEFARLNLPHG